MSITYKWKNTKNILDNNMHSGLEKTKYVNDKKITEEGIPCTLHYRLVEYTEGMDDKELYTGGTQGEVTFIVRPGNWEGQQYDEENYKKNKKDEVLKIVDKFRKR